MPDATALAGFLRAHRGVTILTGAGCSSDSGIPEYRDDDGNWKHARPVQFADFVRHESIRQRYWARSLIGWRRISGARPNGAHRALAALERSGHVAGIITQNVDDLHQRAGSRGVIDLHGNLKFVTCLECDLLMPRDEIQGRLEALNPHWDAGSGETLPDGDAGIADAGTDGFSIPDCRRCGGVLKPHVVFFGEAVPRDRVRAARSRLERTPALLVVGSSLMVWSGFRFVRQARESRKPVAIVNRGATRADDIASCKFAGSCSDLLRQAADELAA